MRKKRFQVTDGFGGFPIFRQKCTNPRFSRRPMPKLPAGLISLVRRYSPPLCIIEIVATQYFTARQKVWKGITDDRVGTSVNYKTLRLDQT